MSKELKTEELAEILDISIKHIHKLENKGIITKNKNGNFSTSDIKVCSDCIKKELDSRGYTYQQIEQKIKEFNNYYDNEKDISNSKTNGKGETMENQKDSKVSDAIVKELVQNLDKINGNSSKSNNWKDHVNDIGQKLNEKRMGFSNENQRKSTIEKSKDLSIDNITKSIAQKINKERLGI